MYSIGYRGGSGGFIFLHFLLLSEKYYVDFLHNKSINEVIQNQWAINDHSRWKVNESWPDNYSTANSESNLEKILFFCNPSETEFFKTQTVFDNWIVNYNNIKDSTWKDLDSFDDFINLPLAVQHEIMQTLTCKNLIETVANPKKQKKFIWLYTDFESQNKLAFYKKCYFYYKNLDLPEISNFNDYTDTWNNIVVDKTSIFFLENSDIQIKLQDWVNEPDILIEHQLIDKVNQKQIDLLNHWKKLHSAELLQKIGIK